MAGEYPGLPNFGYGANVDVSLNDLLALLPNSQKRRQGEANIALTQQETATRGEQAKMYGAETARTSARTAPEIQQLMSQIGVNEAQLKQILDMVPFEQAKSTAQTDQAKAATGYSRSQQKTEDATRGAQERLINAQGQSFGDRATNDRIGNLVQSMGSMNRFSIGADGKPIADPAFQQVQQEVLKLLGIQPQQQAGKSGPTPEDVAAFKQALSARQKPTNIFGGQAPNAYVSGGVGGAAPQRQLPQNSKKQPKKETK